MLLHVRALHTESLLGGNPSPRRFDRTAAQSRAAIQHRATTPIEVIRASAAGNELVPMYWGLIPSWWKKPLAELPSTFNARAETIAERPMFRGAFKYRRCIIPASGFYEWTGAKGAKTPHYSRRATAARSRSRVYGTIGAGSMAATTFRTRQSSSARRIIGCSVFTTECRSFSIGATLARG